MTYVCVAWLMHTCGQERRKVGGLDALGKVGAGDGISRGGELVSWPAQAFAIAAAILAAAAAWPAAAVAFTAAWAKAVTLPVLSATDAALLAA